VKQVLNRAMTTMNKKLKRTPRRTATPPPIPFKLWVCMVRATNEQRRPANNYCDYFSNNQTANCGAQK